MPSNPDNGKKSNEELTEAQIEAILDGPAPLSGDLELVKADDGSEYFIRAIFITSNLKVKLWFTPDGALHFGQQLLALGRQAQALKAEKKLIVPEEGTGPGGLIVP